MLKNQSHKVFFFLNQGNVPIKMILKSSEISQRHTDTFIFLVIKFGWDNIEENLNTHVLWLFF